MKHETRTLTVGCLFIVLLLFSAFTLLPAPVKAMNTVIATIPVGTYPTGVAISPYGDYAYVTNHNNGTVSVINTSPPSVSVSPSSWTLDVGQSKLFTATPSGGSGVYTSYKWYVNGSVQSSQTATTFNFIPVSRGTYSITATVTDNSSTTSPQSTAAAVTVNSMLATPNVMGTVTVGSGPDGVAVTPNGAYAYVSNHGSGTVSVIDTATNMVTATVLVGGQPAGVAITPNGAYAYVTNTGSDTVSVINTTTNGVTATVHVGSFPERVAVTPNGAYAYVINQNDQSVSVINTTTNTVTKNITVGSGPTGVAVTPSGAYAYVANWAASTVSVINTATNTVTATVPVENMPLGVVITPNGAYAYVANWGGNTISVINTATNTVTATITVGSQPFDVTATPNGAYVYVASGGSGTVSVINTITNTVVATVTVGSTPHGVAITPSGAYAYVTNYGGNTVSVVNAVVLSVSASAGSVYQGQTSSLTSTAVTTGTPPYSYAWFVKAPSGSYSLIGGATLSSYSFTTSTSTTTGSWSFILQVTDTTGAAVNFTAVSVTVNSTPTPTPTPGSGGGSESSSSAVTTSMPAPSPIPSHTPSPTPSPTTVTATTDNGSKVELTISGTINSSQMSSISITANQSAASTTLSFTLTGESGTTGFGNVTIPKSAVAYGTTPTIIIDGKPAPDQGYTQDADNYYVWYTTHFSTHQVSIVFTASSSNLPVEAIYGIATAVIVAIVAVALVLRKNKKTKN
jgi:YVTN family beta-propeller protein